MLRYHLAEAGYIGGYAMFFTRHFLIAFLICMAFCVTASSVQAEGKLRSLLKSRSSDGGGERERGGALMKMLGDNGGSGSCAERDAQINKALEGFIGKRAYGPVADIQDVAYGPNHRQNMDVFYTKKKIDGMPAPIIVMVHGGGWCVGDKAFKGTVDTKIERWLPMGFMFISLNYPMVPEGLTALQQADEIAKATAYIQKHASSWGGDPDKIIMMGHSAGAHLVSLVNADSTIRDRQGMAQTLGTVSLDAGAVDVPRQMPDVFPPLKERYKEAFGTNEAEWIKASPHHQLDAKASPWLGVCSTTRPDDPCGQAVSYAEKSKGMGIFADSLPVAMSHGAINKELGQTSQYTKDVEKFMAQLDASIAALLSRR